MEKFTGGFKHIKYVMQSFFYISSSTCKCKLGAGELSFENPGAESKLDHRINFKIFSHT